MGAAIHQKGEDGCSDVLASYVQAVLVVSVLKKRMVVLILHLSSVFIHYLFVQLRVLL